MSRSRASSRASTITMLDEDPHGCCGKCCLRFPWPSIVSFVLLVIGAFSFLAAVHVGANRTKIFFTVGTALSETLRKWLDNLMITTYCVAGFMFVVAVMLLGVSCLATGSTRSSYMCRFRTRKSGRCQTNLFLVITYILYLCWLVVTCLAVIPLLFFHTMKKGVCTSTFQGSDCLDLRQWALVPYDTLDAKANICGDDLRQICEDSKLRLLYLLIFASSLLILVSLVQYLINTSANHSQIRDRYKRSHVSRNTGSYNFRTNERESMSAAERKIKKHGGRTNMPVKAALNGSQTFHGSMHGSLHDSNPWVDKPITFVQSTLERQDSGELSTLSSQHHTSSRDPVYYQEYQI